jgi:Cysteine dioxygenase type I
MPSERACLVTTFVRSLLPSRLRDIVLEISHSPSEWAHLVRFDLSSRFYSRLRVDDAHEVWLICWDIGQDTLLHDHGGSSGAFTVVRGALTEDFGAVHGTGLRTRRHAAGDAVGFGADYLHNLVNVGTEPTVSIHAYSPPLSSMSFYCWLPTGMHQLREIPCDNPEPDTSALEREAARLRRVTA